MLIGFLVLSFAGAASAKKAQIHSAKLVGKTDKDGDGYYSSVTFEIDADFKINERGGHRGSALAAKGEPSFMVMINDGNNWIETGAYTDFSYNQFPYPFQMKMTYEDIMTGRTDNSQKQEDILNGKREVSNFEIQYWESDTPHEVSPKDEQADTAVIVPPKGIMFESAEEDSMDRVTITSDPSRATVYINGEKKGTTPWTGDLPVDMAKRQGPVHLRLEKRGYRSVNYNARISAPMSRNYGLDKLKKPVVIDSDPEGATVTIDGDKVGETPVSKNYWVEKELDVKLEKDGYKTKTINDVKPGNRNSVKLEAEESSSSNDTGTTSDNSFYGGLNNDILYTTPDFNSVGYLDDLITELPELTAWTAARFNASSRKVKTNEAVAFDASGSYAMDSRVVSYRWDFGNGASTGRKTVPTVAHKYSKPGNYTVNLTIWDGNGTQAFTTKHIMVENRVPTPRLDLSTSNIVKGRSVTFNAGRSSDADGSIASYTWDFGDGTKETGSKVSHVYDNSGSYVVKLEVDDNLGAAKTVTQNIDVQMPNQSPHATFKPSSTTLGKGEKVSFDASSSADPDGKLTQYYWDFGDGLSGTGQKVQHNYSQSGTYKVELTVLDDRGETASFRKKIEVKASGSTQSSGSSKAGDKNPDNTGGNNSKDDRVAHKGPIQILVDIIGSLF